MSPHPPIDTKPRTPRAGGAPRWLWWCAIVLTLAAVAVSTLIVVSIVRVDADAPHGAAYQVLAAIFIVPPSLLAATTLLAGICLRRRSRTTVTVLVGIATASAAAVVLPLLSALPMVVAGTPTPDYDATAAADPVAGVQVVSYLYVPSTPAHPLLAQESLWGDPLTEAQRIDAAVSDLVAAPSSGDRLNFWAPGCSGAWASNVYSRTHGVDVEVAGPWRLDTPRCRVTPRQRYAQKQQLAWTIRANLMSPDRRIRVRNGIQGPWTVLRPDPAFGPR